VRRLRSTLLYFVAGALGIATMLAIGFQWLPPVMPRRVKAPSCRIEYGSIKKL
jgi:hypothetical protein